MKRQVLFIGYDTAIQEEIGEFLKGLGGRAWFAASADRSVHILGKHQITTVVVRLHSASDAGILKFINQYYPDIKVLVSASQEFEDVIRILNEGHFKLLSRPLRLSELVLLL
jgi:DNA-binding NtrC family response regulator